MKFRRRGGQAPPSKCVCPNCNYEEKHELGLRCLSRTCPKCGVRLIGKW